MTMWLVSLLSVVGVSLLGSLAIGLVALLKNATLPQKVPLYARNEIKR